MKSTSAFAAALVAMTLVACGSDNKPAATAPGSCTVTATGSNGTLTACIQFGGVTASDIQTACTDPQYCTSGATCSYSTSACSATGRVGRCSVTQGTLSTITAFYGSAANTSALQQACTTQGGSWQAG